MPMLISHFSYFSLFYFLLFLLSLNGVTTQGMVGYWKFNGNVKDESGYNHKGKMDHIKYEKGINGQCIRFSSPKGIQKYIIIENTNDGLTLRQSLTIEAWIKIESFDNNCSQIYTKRNSHSLSICNGKVAVFGIDGWWRPANTDIKAGKWHHIAWTYDGAHYHIYIDGKEIANHPISGLFPTGSEITISHPSFPFKGLLDEVKVYNRALSTVEINCSFYEGSALKGYWPFNGDTKDLSGYFHHGTVEDTLSYEGAYVGLGLRFPIINKKKKGIPVNNSNDEIRKLKAVTLETWLWLETFGNGTYCIIDNLNSYALGIKNGRPVMAIDKVWWVPEINGLKVGKWYYITGTYDGREKRLYLNGTLVAKKIHHGKIAPGSSLHIGSSISEYRGIIDEVKIYDNVLPASVIMQNYKDIPTPVAIWSLDGNTRDKSGLGHHGKVINGAKFSKGKMNQCLYFDGHNDYAVFSNDDHYLDPGLNVTIEAWIKGQFLKGESHHIYDQYRSWALSVKDGRLSLGGRCGWWIPNNTGLNNHIWYHVAGIYNRGERYLYINGLLVNTQQVCITPKYGDGVYLSSPFFPFNGCIDEVKMYDAALSARDIFIRSKIQYSN